ncbi:PREDICTED: uncharacterized protein LOC109155173 [Ipomoea nil]|uniref:uncharacterized protein LOC109155173 n=1 Tax=Ipomoea nil TaxID=35883 RepID=UPI000901DD1F|nr:PREDICTED: uncharacterized protein LOC109155173 [Ipomoea nil]
MCVDYEACPKDPFPLPRIGQLVDETAGSALLSFMDAFRGYHQIYMHKADEEKTTFITPDGVYYYRGMPFGLKNAGATYTRMVARLFQDLLEKSKVAYVDDMLVKTQEESGYARDLAECQESLGELKRAVSSVLIQEEERVQYLIYYVSRSLKSAETRYTPLEKVVYALIVTVRKPSIKGQALADFLVECTAGETKETPTSPGIEGEWWELHADGATSSQHCGGGVMLIRPEGFRLYCALEYQFKVSGTCEAKNARLLQYKGKTEELLRGFAAHEIDHIPKAENTEADILSKITLGGIPDHLLRICQKEEVQRPSISKSGDEVQQLMMGSWDRKNNPEMFWIKDIQNYNEKGELPNNPIVAARVRRKAPSFDVIDRRLYKRSFGGPLLRCLLRPEAEMIMEEAHWGICAAHQGAHTLARKLVI